MSINKYELLNRENNSQNLRKRVAAYCRVSTDKEDQVNSFESQQRYFKQYIELRPDWKLYRIFADEGISGTSTKKRKAFNHMIECALNGDFDLIITKEISRFARNTLDSIFYTRELKKHGVGVLFLNDNIDTLDSDAELRLAIMSSIAQEESRRTSERVKWGQKRRMEQGVVFGRSLLGYDVKAGKMYVNEEGAKIVRLIFHKFVNEGKGTFVIARELVEAGIRPLRAKEWHNTVILRILRNEKYCGDLVQKKTYTPDFLSHEKKSNQGQEEFIIIKDHHKPIVSRELFDQANHLLDVRARSQEGKSKYSRRYPFSGKIKCGRCGASYVARYKTRKDKSHDLSWRCFEGVKHGLPHAVRSDKAFGCPGEIVGCPGESIRNEDIVLLMRLVCRSLPLDRTRISSSLLRTVRKVMASSASSTSSTSPAAEEQDSKMSEIKNTIDTLLSGGEYESSKENESSEEYEKYAECGECEKRKESEESFYAQLLDKIVINDKDHMDVYLNHLPFQWSFISDTAPCHASLPSQGT